MTEQESEDEARMFNDPIAKSLRELRLDPDGVENSKPFLAIISGYLAYMASRFAALSNWSPFG